MPLNSQAHALVLEGSFLPLLILESSEHLDLCREHKPHTIPKARKEKCFFLKTLCWISDPGDPPALPWCFSMQTKAQLLPGFTSQQHSSPGFPTYLGGVERSAELPAEGDGPAGICERPKVMQLSSYSDI